MRRRIVVGALGIIVILGVLVFALSGPKEGSIEWHKREYRANWKGRPLMNLIRAAWREIFPLEMSDGVDHGQALIDLGYWEKQVFVVSNQRAGTVMVQLDLQGKKIVPESELYGVWIETSRTNNVIVFAPPRYMPQFEEAVRKLDVP